MRNSDQHKERTALADLKDAFYYIPLSPESQELLTIEWYDLVTNMKQYSWMVVPQGVLNAPTILGEVVVVIYASWRPQSTGKTEKMNLSGNQLNSGLCLISCPA